MIKNRRAPAGKDKVDIAHDAEVGQDLLMRLGRGLDVDQLGDGGLLGRAINVFGTPRMKNVDAFKTVHRAIRAETKFCASPLLAVRLTAFSFARHTGRDRAEPGRW
jgi:hypothetical protein